MNSRTVGGEALSVTGRGFVAPLASGEPLRHLLRAVDLLGNVEQLARAAYLPPSSLGRMTRGERAIYAEAAIAIERATAGAVQRHELRPDLWQAAFHHSADGVDVTHLTGSALSGPDLIALQDQRFQIYVAAFHRNAAQPNIWNAAALVDAHRAFADTMGLDHV